MSSSTFFFRIHRLFVATLAASFVFASAFAAQAQDDALVVRTTSGLIRGAARAKSGAQFLGIPYAEAPVGPLRWRAPAPPKTWTGVRNANVFGPACMQPVLGEAWNMWDANHSNEDCLYLNVVTPVWPAAKPLPVMFWIHGGANVGGSGSGDLYAAGTLVDHGVLIVSINYRLGILGYFAHPELTRESVHKASGNYGLMDQILALHWVHDNIARFGGDPNNVTVFGQSAGAMDTGMLMTSPLARGSFQKAIAESGAPLYPAPTPLNQAEQGGQRFAASFAIPQGSNPIDFLRKVPAQELIARAASSEWGHSPVGPDIDGYVIPRAPAEIFKAGKEAPIPLLLGTTSREFGSSESADQLRETIERAAGQYAQQGLALYGLADGGQGTDDPLYGPVAIQWGADQDFHCPITTEALWHRDAHYATFEYEFDHAIPGQEAQGALHSAELPYVFGFFPKSGNIGGKFGPVDMRLANLLQSYWSNFAKTGNPNRPGLPPWPQLDGSQRYLDFAADGSAAASTGPLRGPQCDLYRKVLAVKLKHPQ